MPYIGGRLVCIQKESNRDYPFAIVLKKGTETAGPVSHTLSYVCLLILSRLDPETKDPNSKGVDQYDRYLIIAYVLCMTPSIGQQLAILPLMSKFSWTKFCRWLLIHKNCEYYTYVYPLTIKQIWYVRMLYTMSV